MLIHSRVDDAGGNTYKTKEVLVMFKKQKEFKVEYMGGHAAYPKRIKGRLTITQELVSFNSKKLEFEIPLERVQWDVVDLRGKKPSILARWWVYRPVKKESPRLSPQLRGQLDLPRSYGKFLMLRFMDDIGMVQSPHLSIKHIEEVTSFMYEIKEKISHVEKDAHARINEGEALFEQKKYDEAIRCFNEAIKLNPSYELAWNNKGTALYMLKRYKEAIKCFDEVLKINPNNETAKKNRETYMRAMGKI